MLILSRQAFEISSPKDLLINVNSNCVASCLRQGLHTGQPYPCSTACGQKALTFATMPRTPLGTVMCAACIRVETLLVLLQDGRD